MLVGVLDLLLIKIVFVKFLDSLIKACVRYFFMQQMVTLKQLSIILFISPKNLFLFLRYSKFLSFCLSPIFSRSFIALEHVEDKS